MKKTTASEMFKNAYKAKDYTLRDLEVFLGKKFRMIGNYADGTYPIFEGIHAKIADLIFNNPLARSKFLALCVLNRLEYVSNKNMERKNKRLLIALKKKFSADVVPDFFFPLFRDNSGLPVSKELSLLGNINRIKNGQKIYLFSVSHRGVLFKVDTEKMTSTKVNSTDLSNYGLDSLSLFLLVSQVVGRDPLGYLVTSDREFTYINSAQVFLLKQSIAWTLDYINGDLDKLAQVFGIEAIQGDEPSLKDRICTQLKFVADNLTSSYSHASLDKAYKKLLSGIKAIK